MDAARLSLFIGPAITITRTEQRVGGPTLQKLRNRASPAGFYRQEGRVVATRWGRVCFAAPLQNPHINTLLGVEEALGVPYGTIIQTAQALIVEHDQAVAQGMAETKLDRDAFIQQVRTGRWAPTTLA